MCGIAGIHHFNNSGKISKKRLKLMIGALRHRGPDASGLYMDDWTGLGHSRLSIIDLTSGIQPIHNEDKTIWITFNGEIFNYPELRQELTDNGHRFKTMSDTEVLVHLFEEKGEDLVHAINGQFAFVIWNSKTRELLIVRDRVGIRPLYYTVNNGRLLFASEIKSLLIDNSVSREIDEYALDQILTFWTTISDRTIFKEIKELPPGHYLKVINGNISIHRYWERPFCLDNEKVNWDEDRISEEISELLTDSIRIRLRADVDVGTYLSGGLDSSGITSFVSQKFNNRVKTFGIRFDDSAYDEGDQQMIMVKNFNLNHQELNVTNNMIYRSLPEVVWHCEKPILRTAPIPLFHLSELVRQNDLKVVLTGEGADEVFGGYNIFLENKVRRFWARQPGSQYRFRLLERLYPYIFTDKRINNMLRSFFGKGLEFVDDPLYSHILRWKNTSRIKYFLSENITTKLKGYDCLEELREQLPDTFHHMDSFSKAQFLEMKIFMSNYLLSSQGDRVAMAHSVEIRLPFLDHRIIEFMSRVPSKWKIRGLKEKYILKKVFQGLVPDSILNRAKQPFRAPINREILTEENTSMFEGSHKQQYDLFDEKKVKLLINKVLKTDKPSETDSMAIISVLTSCMLVNQFIVNFSETSIQPANLDVFYDMRCKFSE